MDIVSTNHDIQLLEINQNDDGNIIYHFIVDGEKKLFCAKANNNKGIKSIKYLEQELDDLLMSMMKINSSASKILSDITWNYIENGNQKFPVKFI